MQLPRWMNRIASSRSVKVAFFQVAVFDEFGDFDTAHLCQLVDGRDKSVKAFVSHVLSFRVVLLVRVRLPSTSEGQ